MCLQLVNCPVVVWIYDIPCCKPSWEILLCEWSFCMNDSFRHLRVLVNASSWLPKNVIQSHFGRTCWHGGLKPSHPVPELLFTGQIDCPRTVLDFTMLKWVIAEWNIIKNNLKWKPLLSMYIWIHTIIQAEANPVKNRHGIVLHLSTET